MPDTVAPRECSIADVLDLVGERWTLLVVRELSHGVRRFERLVRNIGASRDILTNRLRKLETAGIIRRERYSHHALRYEYHLTAAGWELCDVLLTLMKWGDRHLNPDDPPLRLRHSCDEVLEPALICRHCGEPARKGLHSPTGRGALPAD
ncbi:transcriptional regulator [Actinomadura craniellae]|uniref:Transcriptional regulator n=1 Tax=Actinomadura craniellae TaxID=2231787 RepID=A0A365GZM5_9ACTN|nr:helix-turn-helix domain-containing protein [Actinomadura craniellae]RAY12272.1 transcriptional regulator [Actinomadura craniellae]